MSVITLPTDIHHHLLRGYSLTLTHTHTLDLGGAC